MVLGVSFQFSLFPLQVPATAAHPPAEPVQSPMNDANSKSFHRTFGEPVGQLDQEPSSNNRCPMEDLTRKCRERNKADHDGFAFEEDLRTTTTTMHAATDVPPPPTHLRERDEPG